MPQFFCVVVNKLAPKRCGGNLQTAEGFETLDRSVRRRIHRRYDCSSREAPYSGGFGAACGAQSQVCTFGVNSLAKASTWPVAECAPSFRCHALIDSSHSFLGTTRTIERDNGSKPVCRPKRLTTSYRSLTRCLGRLARRFASNLQFSWRKPLGHELPKIEQSFVPQAPDIREN